MRLTELRIFQYQLPLTRPLPFSGGTLWVREGFLIQLVAENGHEGWGEVAPLPGFSSESLAEAMRNLRRLSLKMAQFWDTFQFMNWPASVRFGIEWAFLELQSRTQGLPLFARESVLLNALLIGTPDEIREQAHQANLKGYVAAKLKVGHRTVAEDLRMVMEVHEILGETCALRLDANRAWREEQAADFARHLPEGIITYLEEPLQNPKQIPAYQATFPHVPIALDESLRESVGSQLLQQYTPAALVLKPMLDPQSAFAYASLPFPKVLSSSVESGLGTRALVAMATILTDSHTAIGLDTYNWLAEDVLTERLGLDVPVVLCNTMQHIKVAREKLVEVM